MIRLDFTSHTVVAVCDLCPWRNIGPDRLTVWRLAAAHEKTVHPETTQAQQALSTYLHRHNRRCAFSSVTARRKDKAHGNH